MSLRSVKLRVESLEDRSVPSGTTGIEPVTDPIAVASPIAVVSPAAPIFHSALVGRAQGTYTSSSLIVDAGASYQLSGSGHFGILGDATVSGSLHGVGMIANGHATGTLTFTNGHGTVTISLEGPAQAGFAPLPTWYQYHVVSATGSYQNLKDHGTLRIDFQQTPATVPPTGQPVPMPPIHLGGTFRLAI